MTAQALPLTPDFGTWPVLHWIAEVTHQRGTVDVVWDDGKTSRFHFRWLRDMCPCRHCHNPVTRKQSLDISTVPRDIAPLESTVDACGALAITWSHAAHASRYHTGWLRANDYSSTDTAAEAGIPQPTWDAGFAGEIPTFDAAAVLTRDEALYDGIQTFFELTRDTALRAEFPIQEGDVIAFDNRRILHARNAYDPSSGGRHLQGCYLDRDELLSRIRVLERHLGRIGFPHG